MPLQGIIKVKCAPISPSEMSELKVYRGVGFQGVQELTVSLTRIGIYNKALTDQRFWLAI